jgi:glycosyltransferase involved in cell wall biosynthesis
MSTIPVLIGSERGIYEREVSVLRRWGHLLGRSLTEPLSDLTVANSVALKRHLSDTGVAASRIRVVHNGFDFGRLPKIDHRSRNLREEIGLPESTRVVGTIARLDRDKDLGTFLSAAALTVQRVGDVHFVVVGGGDPSYGDELVELSRRLNLSDRVWFTGERSDALALLAQFDVLVLTSRMESFPNALMEGMALSKPIVATCVGGVPELVVDGVTGFLCPPGDPIAFSERLCAVLSDKETALSLGRNGNIRLRERFSVDCMVKAYSDLYRDQLYRPRRS